MSPFALVESLQPARSNDLLPLIQEQSNLGYFVCVCVFFNQIGPHLFNCVLLAVAPDRCFESSGLEASWRKFVKHVVPQKLFL